MRETGTFLYLGEAGDLWHLLYWELRLMPGSRFFRWDGDRLCELTLAEAIVDMEHREKRLHEERAADLSSPEAGRAARLARLRADGRV